MVTADQGVTWVEANRGVTRSEGWCLARHPRTGELWYGAGPASIFRSADGGETWSACEAIDALPERLRHVVTAYFFEERPMLDIAGELGVTESRISQLRAEALTLLKDGLNTHLDPDLTTTNRPTGCVTRRREAYYAQIAAQGSDESDGCPDR